MDENPSPSNSAADNLEIANPEYKCETQTCARSIPGLSFDSIDEHHNKVLSKQTAQVLPKNSEFSRLRNPRPVSLIFSHKHDAIKEQTHLLHSSLISHDRFALDPTSNSSNPSPARRRPVTWHRARTSSVVVPNSSLTRLHTGNFTGTADSEALRLVLSSHSEPVKASVTEKFAQFLSMDEDLHVEHRFQSPHVHKFTLKHYSVFKAVWDWIILVLIIYTAIATPFVTVFLTSHGNKYAKLISFRNISSTSDGHLNSHTAGLDASDSFSLLRTVDVMVDIMFFVDIFINFRTTYVNKNDEVVSHPRRIAAHYLKGWFFIDLVAAIPFDLIFFQSSSDQHTTLTSLLKSARLLRLVGIVRKLDRYSEYGASILLLLTALFALIAHWLACIWYAIGNAEHQYREPKTGWLDTLAQQTEQFYTDDPQSGPNLQTKYITALYFTFSSLTSIGFGNVSPNTNAEKVFSIVVMLVGSLMYASIFGNVGALIQRLYSGTARYHAQMLRIKEFIRFHQIPSPLRQRLEEYSTQVWEHTNGIDMTTVQYSFPESLQSDICLYVYREILGGSPAFKSLNDGCLRNLSLRIRASHMPPSDTLIHTGDLLNAVYYVVKGSLEVVTTDDLILGVLNPGDFFGGLPILVDHRNRQMQHFHDVPSQSSTLGGSHPSTPGFPSPLSAVSMAPPPKSRFAVRALTYADVQFIDRHDLSDLCHVYPELCDRILDRFELTIPLVTSVAGVHEHKTSSPWLSGNHSLESFLTSNATWKPVSPSLLSNLVPVFTRRPPRTDIAGSNSSQPDEYFSTDLPVWELERLQRLFLHGTVCPSVLQDAAPVSMGSTLNTQPSCSSASQSTQVVDVTWSDPPDPVVSSTSIDMPSVCHPNSAFPFTPTIIRSVADCPLRRIFMQTRSPPFERRSSTTHIISPPGSTETPSAEVSHEEMDNQGVTLLFTRISRLERQFQELNTRLSDTLSTVLNQLQSHVHHSASVVQ